MAKPLLSAGLVLGLAFGVGGCSEAPQRPGERPTTANTGPLFPDQENIRQAFDAQVAYFVGRGLLSSSDVELVLLGEGQTLDCGGQTFTAEDPEYCGNKVIIGSTFIEVDLAQWASAAAPGDPERQREIELDGERFVVGHELAHKVQDALGLINTEDQGVYEESKEPQADCYAGEAMQATAPGDVSNVEALLEQFPKHDLAHGAPNVRIAAFKLGTAGSGCQAAAIVALRTSMEGY